MTGNVYTNTRRAIHPSHAVIFDDIYFGYLVFRAFSNRSLTLVNARLSEVDKSKPLEERLDTLSGLVRIYHKLKTDVRFGWINQTRTLNALKQRVRSKFACLRRQGRNNIFSVWQVRGLTSTSNTAQAPGEFGVLSHANLTTCCERWSYCDGSGGPRPRRVSTKGKALRARAASAAPNPTQAPS